MPRIFEDIMGLQTVDTLGPTLPCDRCGKVMPLAHCRFYSWVLETLTDAADSAAVLCDDCTTGLDDVISNFIRNPTISDPD